MGSIHPFGQEVHNMCIMEPVGLLGGSDMSALVTKVHASTVVLTEAVRCKGMGNWNVKQE